MWPTTTGLVFIWRVMRRRCGRNSRRFSPMSRALWITSFRRPRLQRPAAMRVEKEAKAATAASPVVSKVNRDRRARKEKSLRPVGKGARLVVSKAHHRGANKAEDLRRPANKDNRAVLAVTREVLKDLRKAEASAEQAQEAQSR